MNTRSLSIIIPTYQHGKTIAACLDSILAQTLLPSEIIVVNDGSTDETADRLKLYEGRVRVLNQVNQGGNVARNHGFDASDGSFVLFCDADVVMRPEMLQKLSDALETHPQASFAYSAFRFGWKHFSSYPFSAERLKRMNYIHTSALIRRQAFPGFDPSLKRFQDWDVWLTMLETGATGILVPEELFRIQNHRGRKGISEWRPSFLYRFPWKLFGWKPESLRRYDLSKELVRRKHGL